MHKIDEIFKEDYNTILELNHQERRERERKSDIPDRVRLQASDLEPNERNKI